MTRTSPATITAAFGRQYELENDAGERLLGYPRGKKSPFACGDRVDYTAEGAIVHLHPRRNLLYRSDAFREKLIAANLDQVVLVVATEPAFSDELLTRCLCAIEAQEMTALIVLNKVDVQARLNEARERLAPFARLGYPLLELSALTEGEEALTRLRPHLTGRQSILVGQSGMGKSTLLNALVPGAAAATREISTALASGKHTTTFARRYDLAGGGSLIDSPGLQAFGLAHLSDEALVHGFRELRPYLGHCRFRDCRHDAEPGCALRAAVGAGTVDPRRFDQYALLRDELAAARRLNPGW